MIRLRLLGALLLCPFLATPLSASFPEDEARQEAVYLIQQMHSALYVLETELSKLPADPHDPTWVSFKIKNMALIDQLLRRVLMESVMKNQWPDTIRRVFVEYFINFDADLSDLDSLGFLQKNDYYQYEYLKQLMLSSEALGATGGWPLISKYGELGDYYAFIIAQHGQAYDMDWQREVLIPRLQIFSEHGECSEIAYLWLKNAEAHQMDEIARLMELSGGIWAEMIPEVSRMQHFFLALPSIMEAEQVAPLLAK